MERKSGWEESSGSGPHACTWQEHEEEVPSDAIVDVFSDRTVEFGFSIRAKERVDDANSKEGLPLRREKNG